VPLEERPASQFVDLDGVVPGDALVPIREHVLLARLFDGFLEEGFVPVKTELVHWVNLDEVVQHEEENTRNSSALSELLTSVINLTHGDLSGVQCLLNCVGCLFGRL
jgi:hypothetical protein